MFIFRYNLLMYMCCIYTKHCSSMPVGNILCVAYGFVSNDLFHVILENISKGTHPGFYCMYLPSFFVPFSIIFIWYSKKMVVHQMMINLVLHYGFEHKSCAVHVKKIPDKFTSGNYLCCRMYIWRDISMGVCATQQTSETLMINWWVSARKM